MSVAFAVQTAMDRRLGPVLEALTPPVPLYDHPPPGAPLPFVQFLRVTVTPENLVAARVTRVQVSFGVFSDFRGQEQVHGILAAIEAALDGAELVLDSGIAVRCDLERADSVRDQDGVTYTGTAIYSVLVQH